MHTRRAFLGGLSVGMLALNHSTQSRACWKGRRCRHFVSAVSDARPAPTNSIMIQTINDSGEYVGGNLYVRGTVKSSDGKRDFRLLVFRMLEDVDPRTDEGRQAVWHNFWKLAEGGLQGSNLTYPLGDAGYLHLPGSQGGGNLYFGAYDVASRSGAWFKGVFTLIGGNPPYGYSSVVIDEFGNLRNPQSSWTSLCVYLAGYNVCLRYADDDDGGSLFSFISISS